MYVYICGGSLKEQPRYNGRMHHTYRSGHYNFLKIILFFQQSNDSCDICTIAVAADSRTSVPEICPSLHRQNPSRTITRQTIAVTAAAIRRYNYAALCPLFAVLRKLVFKFDDVKYIFRISDDYLCTISTSR